MASLEFYDGDRLVFRHRLGPGRAVVGRSDGCDLWLHGEGISRRHAVFEPRGGGWWLMDRSRNGTRVNGEEIDRVELSDGDLVQLGDREARFVLRDPGATGSTTRMVRSLLHEEPVGVGRSGLAVARAVVRITAGPEAGREEVLDRTRVHIGGSDDDDLVLADLPPRAATLDVVRGRVILTPRAWPAHVGTLPVPAPMPVYEGEDVVIGEHTLEVHTKLDEVEEGRSGFGELVGEDPVMRQMFSALSRIAAHEHPVLLVGESGTGKELAAKALHEEGLRGGGPFVPVNCAALPDALLESELFGHEKGAFTGATERQDGAFQRADGGTLFLDEIGELRLDAQAKLLRALESREVRRVGGARPEHPDVRVVAATNRDLPAMVQDGTFREDLFFRLSVLRVELPALRERPDDIPVLVRTLVRRLLPGAVVTDEAMDKLQSHAWPGNVRELRNVLTRAYVMGGPTLDEDAITFSMPADPAGFVSDTRVPTEADRIQAALDTCRGNRAAAARRLGIPRTSLLYRMRKHGLA